MYRKKERTFVGLGRRIFGKCGESLETTFSSNAAYFRSERSCSRALSETGGSQSTLPCCSLAFPPFDHTWGYF
jgi:hypothetical protein